MDTSFGPFTLHAGRDRLINGRNSRTWTLGYGEQELAQRTYSANLVTQSVREAFGDVVGSFTAKMRSRHGGGLVYLHDAITGEDVASFATADALVPGMSAGLPDDRWQYWLVSSRRPTCSTPLASLADFGRLMAEHEMPANGWIAGLLPEDVLTTDPEQWRAPSPWEIRHVVGEGSFTSTTGAAAAAVVGVTPQNFRKYLAPEGASTHQRMSFAMWHLLLHRLGVQTLAPHFDCAQAAGEMRDAIFPSLPQGS